MSTRATIHFEERQTRRYDPETRKVIDLDEPVIDTSAIVYRHSDGYPDGLGADLVRFIQEVRQLPDSRLGDASYLAAKWVVFDASGFYDWMVESNAHQRENGAKPYYAEPVSRLGFLSIGIVSEDPGDIEYRYHVVCDGTVDFITYETRGGDWDTPTWDVGGILLTREVPVPS